MSPIGTAPSCLPTGQGHASQVPLRLIPADMTPFGGDGEQVHHWENNAFFTIDVNYARRGRFTRCYYRAGPSKLHKPTPKIYPKSVVTADDFQHERRGIRRPHTFLPAAAEEAPPIFQSKLEPFSSYHNTRTSKNHSTLTLPSPERSRLLAHHEHQGTTR